MLDFQVQTLLEFWMVLFEYIWRLGGAVKEAAFVGWNFVQMLNVSSMEFQVLCNINFLLILLSKR